MIDDALSKGANGIVSVRITTNSVASNASELMAYGTAVIVEPDQSYIFQVQSQQQDNDIDEAAEIAKQGQPIDVNKPAA